MILRVINTPFCRFLGLDICFLVSFSGEKTQHVRISRIFAAIFQQKMIAFLEHKQIDPIKWNAAVEQSPAATLFAHYEWLTVANPTWCALVEGDYEAVMPLPCRFKWGILYIYTPHFLSRLGLFAPPNSQPHLLNAFFDAIPKRFCQIDLILNVHNFLPVITETRTFCSYQLSLNQPYFILYKQYSDNHKRNLKKAAQTNLQYHESGNVAEIIALFKQNRGQDKGVHFAENDYLNLQQMADMALKTNQLDVITVTNTSGQLLSGALFLKDRQRTWFWFSGRDAHAIEQKAMFFLLDEYIKRHENQPIVLDFNGSTNENIARLYHGFGGEKYEMRMWCCSRNKVVKWLKMLKV
jgi:hypothetical protein